MRFVLDSGNQFKSLRTGVYGKLQVIIIQSSGAVIVIFYHAADRDGKPQLLQHRQGRVHLAPAPVHHQQIRKPGKAAILLPQLLFLHLLPLLQTVAETPGEHFSHTGIVVRAGNGLYAEFPVVAGLGLSLFKDNHGAHILKSVDIGDVKGLHALNMFQAQNPCNLLHRPDSAAFLPLQPLPVLFQNMLRVLGRQLHELLLGSDLGNPQIHPSPLAAGEPFFNQLPISYVALKHQLPWNKRGARVKLFDKILQDLPPGIL